LKLLNYFEHKKTFNPDAHVRIFKAAIKANGETIDEEMANMFNFTLKDNASNWCNSYMKVHLNCRFVDLEHVFSKC
jgi:hypothetical protein